MKNVHTKKALGVRRWALGLILLSLSAEVLAQTGSTDLSLKQLVESKELKSAHIGVYVYDDSAKKEIANYQGDKYFVPASNTKLFSLYAGLKYLGDSLEGIRYWETDTAILIYPVGDPSFLHPDYQSQPVMDFLKKTKKKIYFVDGGWHEIPLGPGWAWDDYNEDYSIERSQFPIYGNFIRWTQEKSASKDHSVLGESISATSSPEISWPTHFSPDSLPDNEFARRNSDSNIFTLHLHLDKNTDKEVQDVPFITNNLQTAIQLLKDTLGKPVYVSSLLNINYKVQREGYKPLNAHYKAYAPPVSVYSRPVDSVFMPMMYRSDNFFAEQTLLMASYQKLQYMNDAVFIDTLLKTDLADLPQKPNWVDGSGLSRYNLFTPMDFVTLLIKFKNEFGMDRMKRILPTGGVGTLKNYYKSETGYIFMKTGSMSGVICISGYLYTLKNHLLEFSVLVNNEKESGATIRREVEFYVQSLRRNN